MPAIEVNSTAGALHLVADVGVALLVDHVAGLVDDVEVVPGAAAQGVCANAAVQDVGEGVAGQQVAEGIAGGVDGGSGESQMLDLRTRRQAEGDGAFDRVDAAAASSVTTSPMESTT